MKARNKINRKPVLFRARQRQMPAQQIKALDFHMLEDRQMLAVNTVGCLADNISFFD